MDDTRRIVIWVISILAVVCVCIALYYFFTRTEPDQAPLSESISVKEAGRMDAVKEEREEEAEEVEPLQVPLDESDSVIRELAQALSSDEIFALWLKSDDLVRKFTAAVDNIANGLSPRAQIDFFSPGGKFNVTQKDGFYYVDPASYRRYDGVADIFSALDTERFVNLYRQSEFILQEAYRDLGYPGADFNSTFQRAIVELLKVPVVEEDLILTSKVLTYRLADPELEKLSHAQKHLLRMGPDNVRLIQGKLREIADVLGIPEDALPW